jgi:hypothetical protein
VSALTTLLGDEPVLSSTAVGLAADQVCQCSSVVNCLGIGDLEGLT